MAAKTKAVEEGLMRMQANIRRLENLVNKLSKKIQKLTTVYLMRNGVTREMTEEEERVYDSDRKED